MSDQQQIPVEWQINRLVAMVAPWPRMAGFDLGDMAEAQEGARARLAEMIGSDHTWRAAALQSCYGVVNQVVSWGGRSHSCLRDRASELRFMLALVIETRDSPTARGAPPGPPPAGMAEAREALAGMDSSDPAWRGTLQRACQGVIESIFSGRLAGEEEEWKARDEVEQMLNTALATNPPALRNGMRLAGDPAHTPFMPGRDGAMQGAG